MAPENRQWAAGCMTAVETNDAARPPTLVVEPDEALAGFFRAVLGVLRHDVVWVGTTDRGRLWMSPCGCHDYQDG